MAGIRKSAAAAGKNETTAENVPESTVRQQGLPLFFQKPAALEKTRHAKSTVSAVPNLSFARTTNSLAINAIEFIEAAKYYPIAFTPADEPMALAIVGLENDNYFLDAHGNWRADTYIPAYVRQYPFIFFEEQEQNKFFLCVDEKSVHFSAEGREGDLRLFNDDGTPSVTTNQALEFCSSYYRHHAITRNFARDLKKHNLLTPYQSQIKLQTGRTVTLSGFMMIDENAFNALPDDVFLDFRAKGWLPFIYLALTSASNWKRLGNLAELQATAAQQ